MKATIKSILIAGALTISSATVVANELDSFETPKTRFQADVESHAMQYIVGVFCEGFNSTNSKFGEEAATLAKLAVTLHQITLSTYQDKPEAEEIRYYMQRSYSILDDMLSKSIPKTVSKCSTRSMNAIISDGSRLDDYLRYRYDIK